MFRFLYNLFRTTTSITIKLENNKLQYEALKELDNRQLNITPLNTNLKKGLEIIKMASESRITISNKESSQLGLYNKNLETIKELSFCNLQNQKIQHLCLKHRTLILYLKKQMTTMMRMMMMMMITKMRIFRRTTVIMGMLLTMKRCV